MIILNYQLSLPHTFDMAALRARIPSIGARFDAVPGIGAKAFLVREKGVNGSPLNQYAPFYLFTSESAAAAFLWEGEEFSGVVAAYGRPVAQTWIGGGYLRGPAIATTPSWAVRRVTRLPVDEAPARTAAAAHDSLLKRANESGLHSAAFGIDPRTWELVAFSMHVERPDPKDGELYEVVHLSAPDEAGLAARN
jgi:hypothetical protein